MGLDLENGDEELAEATPAQRRAAARKAAGEDRPSTAKKTSSARRSSTKTPTQVSKLEAELTSRLHRTFDRIAQTLDARGDQELAEVIREDGDAISQGFISLTRNVRFLLSPLIMLLNLVEPVLAFGRVGRILYRRWVERQQRTAEQATQQSQSEVFSSPVATQ